MILATPIGVWRGYGICGANNLTLEASIRIVGDNDVNGTLTFSYMNIDAMATIRGLYQQTTADIVIVLDNWISKPPPQLTFSLIGKHDPAGGRITGDVSGTSCSSEDRFVLTKAETRKY